MRSVKLHRNQHVSITLTLIALMGLSASATATATAKEKPPQETTATEKPSIAPTRSTSEKLLEELDTAYGVTLGKKTSQPQLIAFILPDHEPSRTFWLNIRDHVKKGELRVRLYPAGLQNSPNEKAAALLLAAKDPWKSWDRYASGDKTALKGAPTPQNLEKIRANTALIDRWHFSTAPYLLYRSSSGTVKIVPGNPRDIEAVIKDIAPGNQAEKSK